MEFLAGDIERITGVKRNRLQQWLERGFIAPSIQMASGHGTRNIWSRNDLYTIALFKKITESGLSRKVVSDFLSAGIIGGDTEAVNSTYCLVYMREGEKVEAEPILYFTTTGVFSDGTPFVYGGTPTVVLDHSGNTTNLGIINLPQIQKRLGMEAFDDMYVVNFFKVKAEVDAKIEEG